MTKNYRGKLFRANLNFDVPLNCGFHTINSGKQKIPIDLEPNIPF